MESSINNLNSENDFYSDCDTPYNTGNTKTSAEVSCCTLGGFVTVLFAFMTVVGQLTQYICMPLWVDSTKNATASKTGPWKPSMDNYFVLSFACFVFVMVFGCALAISNVMCPSYFAKTDWTYCFLLLRIGFFQGVSGLFIVFASNGNKTPPYLQAILGNFSIPVTLILRFILLKKIPTRRKLISAMVVFVCLFICLIPTIFPEIDPHSARHLGGEKGAARILWPFAFMFGFAVGGFAFIIEEKALKMKKENCSQASLIAVLFWTSLSQFLTAVILFWVDLVPGIGEVHNIHEFSQNWWFGLQCVFGAAGCTSTPMVVAFLFIAGYIMTVFGSALVLRYSEGATLLAILSSLSTPLGFIFWTLFQEKPSIHWNPKVYMSSWFSIGALLAMVPAVFIYNTGAPEREKLGSDLEREQIGQLLYDEAMPAS